MWDGSTPTRSRTRSVATGRIDAITADLLAFRSAVSQGSWSTGQPVFSPGQPLPNALKRATGASLKASSGTVKHSKLFTLYGVLSPAQPHDSIRIDMRKPGSSKWILISVRSTAASGAWSLRYKIAKRGTYSFRVRYLGDGTRLPAVSRTMKIAVR